MLVLPNRREVPLIKDEGMQFLDWENFCDIIKQLQQIHYTGRPGASQRPTGVHANVVMRNRVCIGVQTTEEGWIGDQLSTATEPAWVGCIKEIGEDDEFSKTLNLSMKMLALQLMLVMQRNGLHAKYK